jgi:hypothetical protein
MERPQLPADPGKKTDIGFPDPAPPRAGSG